MDGLKPGRGSYSRQPHERSSHHASRPVQSHSSSTSRHSGEKYWLVRSLGKVASRRKTSLWNKFKKTEFAQWPDKALWRRVYAGTTLVLFIFSTVAGILQPFIDDKFYGVTEAARSVLPQPKESLGTFLTMKDKEAKFVYNDGYTGSTSSSLSKTGQGEPRITASFAKEASKGMTVSDPVNKIDFKMTPKFKLNVGKQDRNQLFYPLAKQAGYLVFTAQTASVKEDIVLEKKTDDRQEFSYDLDLGDSLEARLEKNGSVGVYGSSLPINGNVATGSDKDAELLQKARENSEKSQLLFVIPKPVVVESGRAKGQTVVNSWFELDGRRLTLVSENLKNANYPLSIDPSVYVQSAAQLMRGNNESNVEFDIATEQFKKGTTTGARIDEWTNTTDMSSSVWDQGMAAAGGYVYRAGGRTSSIGPEILGKKVTTQATASGTFTMNMPTTRPAGDLYVAIIAHHNSAATINTPAGWTNYNNANEHAAFYRVGGSNEPATYDFTISTGSQQYAGVIIRVGNYGSIGTSASGNATSGAPTYPAVTATNPNTLLIRGSGFDDDIPPETGYSPADHFDIASGYSNGTTASTSGAGFTASALKSAPLSGSSTVAAAISGPNDSYGASSLIINGTTVTNTMNSSLEWAHFNSTDGSIDSPAPGSNETACSGWCTNSAYNLPSGAGTGSGAGRVGMQMIAYNGYLYVIGGSDGTNIKSTVYIAKLGAKGEPSLWHPSDPDQPDWVYWYKNPIDLPSTLTYTAAYAYNGKMYLVGGDTDTSVNSGATNAVRIADILPNGELGSWSSGPNLPANRYGAAVQGYNGYIYVLGGSNNGSMLSTVHYSRINSDGSLGNWQVANLGGVTGFSGGRSSHGGLMAGIWGAYIYIAGGCAGVNGSGYCNDVRSDVQLASINADGTLDDWNTILNLDNRRFGYSFIAWQDNLYRFGGCGWQDQSTGECYWTQRKAQYGNINQDGDASTVSITTADGLGLCQGDDPYDCNLPPGGTGAGQAGQALSATAVISGYLYVIGGCTTNACTTMTRNTAYVAIDSNGKLKSPPTCPGEKYGAWCIDNTNLLTTGVGAAGTAVFGGYIYLVGGQTGSAGSNTLQRNTVNSDGSLAGAWQNQSLSGVGALSVSYTYAYARANPASAGTNPGNLFIFGGCSDPATGAGCTSGNNYTQNVYKCNIEVASTIAGCSTSGQLPIGTIPSAINPGLGIHAGTVYANYIYLIGGVADGFADIPTVRYAKFDNSNNVVAVSGGSWVESNVEMNHGRRRGTAFGYNGYLYAVGGYDSVSGSVLDTVEFVKINVSDGSLVSTVAKPGSPGRYLFTESAVTINQRWGLGIAVSNSFAYIIGGCKDGVSPTCNANGLDDTVQTFQIYNNDSGAPGGYSLETDLFANDRIGASAAVLNGYMYIAGGCISATDCTDATDSVQYAALDAYGNVGAWQAGGNLPAQRAWGQLEVAGGALYYMGGQSDTNTDERSEVYYTTGFSSGNPAWSGSAASKGIGDTGSGGQLRTRFAATSWNNRLYVVGGLDGSGAATSTVYISPILSSGGNITGNWSTGTSLSVARSGATAIAYANNLYVFGGQNGSLFLSDSQFSKINSASGASGSWTYTTSLPKSISGADGFGVNGYMYIIGGRSSTNDCTPSTLVAPISANTAITGVGSGNDPTGIGEWYETNRRYDAGRYGAAAVYAQGKAYVLGGACQGIVMQDDFDPGIDSGEWSYTTGMTAGTACQSTSTSNTLYTNNGGSGNYAATKSVDVSAGGTVYFKLYIPLADTGTCFRNESTLSLLTPQPENVQLEYSLGPLYSSWSAVTTAYTYNQQDPLKTYAVTIPPAAQSAGTRFRWIMLNGEASDSFAIEDVRIIATNNTTLTYTANSRVQYTPLLSQPQIANYSRLIDASHDVFPTTWLMNGIDNSIGARWQLSYRSMNDSTVTDTSKACGGSAMSSFGALTNYGDVTLQTPGPYTVKNGAGSNISCSRYFFMNISIDASRTYGYPDDITRGPTLDNFTLFFQSNPGQRLLHGKTFIDGGQQPLDTQCRQSNPLDTQLACPAP